MVWQFSYVHGVAGISLLLGKKYKVRQYSFSHSQQRQQPKTLITKTMFFYILCTGFTLDYKPLLHGLSLKKYPIKKHATLFGSSRVINWIKHN